MEASNCSAHHSTSLNTAMPEDVDVVYAAGLQEQNVATNAEACECHTCTCCMGGTCTKQMALISHCRSRACGAPRACLAQVNQINTFTSNHLSTASHSHHTVHPGVANQRLDHHISYVLIVVYGRDVKGNAFQVWLNGLQASSHCSIPCMICTRSTVHATHRVSDGSCPYPHKPHQPGSYPGLSHLSHTQFDNTARSHVTDVDARYDMRIDDLLLYDWRYIMSTVDHDSCVAFRGIKYYYHSLVATTTPHAAAAGMLRVY
jgi:hypothetical protein